MDQSFVGYGAAAYGFGKFVQLVLVFSTVALIIPSIYSTSLSMQNVGMWAVKIPRFVWATVAFVVFTVAAIAGREHFASVLSNRVGAVQAKCRADRHARHETKTD
jgi:purine-cytosine permease-like protein